MPLPFVAPDRELRLNLCNCMIAIGLSDRGKKKRGLSKDRLHVFLCLIKNPILLNRVLKDFAAERVELSTSELFNLSSTSTNFDILFDRNLLKLLLRQLISTNHVEALYSPKTFITFVLTEKGEAAISSLDSPYFEKVKSYTRSMAKISGVLTSNLYRSLENLLAGSFQNGL